jgi:tRNA-dihydrouridine synthase
MSLEPGAIAAPMNDIVDAPTRINLRAWKVSDSDAIRGAKTACTTERELGTQVPATVLLRSASMYESYLFHYKRLLM